MYGKAWQLTQQITRSATWKFPHCHTTNSCSHGWSITCASLVLSPTAAMSKGGEPSVKLVSHLKRIGSLFVCWLQVNDFSGYLWPVSNRSLLCDLVVRDWREPHPAFFNGKGMAPSFCEDGHKSAQPICWSCCRRNFVMFVWLLKVKRCQKSLWGPVFLYVLLL